LYRKQPAHNGRALTISLGPVNHAATICCAVVWGVTTLPFKAEPVIMAQFLAVLQNIFGLRLDKGKYILWVI
jgi:hypothetical protein